MFLGKDILKICSKVKGEHKCRSAISIKLHASLLKSHFSNGRSPVNFLHVFRTPLHNNTSGGLLLNSKRFERSFISFFNLTPEIVTKSIYYII